MGSAGGRDSQSKGYNTSSVVLMLFFVSHLAQQRFVVVLVLSGKTATKNPAQLSSSRIDGNRDPSSDAIFYSQKQLPGIYELNNITFIRDLKL